MAELAVDTGAFSVYRQRGLADKALQMFQRVVETPDGRAAIDRELEQIRKEPLPPQSLRDSSPAEQGSL